MDTMLVKNDFAELINECFEYIESGYDGDEDAIVAYTDELEDCCCTEELVETGIFHDAIGEFISFEEDKRYIKVLISY